MTRRRRVEPDGHVAGILARVAEAGAGRIGGLVRRSADPGNRQEGDAAERYERMVRDLGAVLSKDPEAAGAVLADLFGVIRVSPEGRGHRPALDGKIAEFPSA